MNQAMQSSDCVDDAVNAGAVNAAADVDAAAVVAAVAAEIVAPCS